jgi:hypothetical protein
MIGSRAVPKQHKLAGELVARRRRATPAMPTGRAQADRGAHTPPRSTVAISKVTILVEDHAGDQIGGGFVSTFVHVEIDVAVGFIECIHRSARNPEG